MDSWSEADLYIAESEDHQRYAFKLYRSFTRPSAVVAQALARLQSGRLSIPVFRDECQGRALEVTEYFPQGNLAEYIKKNGALDKEQALHLLRQVNEGLEQLANYNGDGVGLDSSRYLFRFGSYPRLKWNTAWCHNGSPRNISCDRRVLFGEDVGLGTG